MREAVIVASVRTALGKALRGTLRTTRPDDMAAACIREILSRAPSLPPEEIDDVVIGCAAPEKQQGFNIGRVAALRAGLPYSVPAMTVNRFCASGLQSIAQSAERIVAGGADVILAGGAETMSLLSMLGGRMYPNPTVMDEIPDLYDAMGLTAENVRRKYDVSREDQDVFAYESHQKAIAAVDEGRFEDEIVPLQVTIKTPDRKNGIQTEEIEFKVDEGPRRDTTVKKLGKLRPVFDPTGTVTAGNCSQTTDGAAMTLLMSREKAEALGLPILAVFRGYTVAGIDPAIMGVAPIEAIPKALKRTGIALGDIKMIELNEAFAVQSLAIIRELGLDPERINVNGGAIALGHPLGCTGARLTATLIHELRRRGGGLGMVTMCVAGGMGAAGIFEVVE